MEPWSVADIQRLATMRLAGYTVDQIASVLGRSNAAVDAQIARQGFTTVRPSATATNQGKHWSKLEESMLVYYVRKGLSTREIATLLSRDKQAVQNKIQHLRRRNDGRL